LQLCAKDEQEMDMELALVATARHEIGAVLQAAQKFHPWHYAPSGVTTNDLTWASLLRMMPEQSYQLHQRASYASGDFDAKYITGIEVPIPGIARFQFTV
jgi:hypothetical protein